MALPSWWFPTALRMETGFLVQPLRSHLPFGGWESPTLIHCSPSLISPEGVLPILRALAHLLPAGTHLTRALTHTAGPLRPGRCP